MSDQYPSGGGPTGDAEPRIRGAFGEVGEPVEDSSLSLAEQARAARAGDLVADDDAAGDGETLPPSPDQV